MDYIFFQLQLYFKYLFIDVGLYFGVKYDLDVSVRLTDFQHRHLAPSPGIMPSVCLLWEHNGAWKHVYICTCVSLPLIEAFDQNDSACIVSSHCCTSWLLCNTLQWGNSTRLSLWRSVFFCAPLSDGREEVSAGCNLICVADVLI